MRGRTLSRASSRRGSASSLSSIVTSAAGAEPGTGSILVTLPTSTPAIRTTERACRLRASTTAALST